MHFHSMFFLPLGKLRFSVGTVFSCVCMLLLGVFLVSISHQFFTRNIQDTSTKLSGIIYRPPEQIKFKYYDSNSLLWLDKSKNPILNLDLDLELSMPSLWLDWLSAILQGALFSKQRDLPTRAHYVNSLWWGRYVSNCKTPGQFINCNTLFTHKFAACNTLFTPPGSVILLRFLV